MRTKLSPEVKTQRQRQRERVRRRVRAGRSAEVLPPYHDVIQRHARILETARAHPGESYAEIAARCEVSRPLVYKVLGGNSRAKVVGVTEWLALVTEWKAELKPRMAVMTCADAMDWTVSWFGARGCLVVCTPDKEGGANGFSIAVQSTTENPT